MTPATKAKPRTKTPQERTAAAESPSGKASENGFVFRKTEPYRATKGAYVYGVREWDRATDLIEMFIATGALENARPASVMFISEPGSGKTELLDRFQINPQLVYASDLTVSGLNRILESANKNHVTHIVATEMQKFFLRKSSTWENTLGRLCQALEEGVHELHLGDLSKDMGGAKVGLIAAITEDTMTSRGRILRETGFWSRVAAFEWNVPDKELYDVMGRIGRNDMSDLTPKLVKLPKHRHFVEMPEPLSRQVQDYIRGDRALREMTVLRLFMRFRALCMACALLDQRDVVHARDVEKVFAFNTYWQRMVGGSGVKSTMGGGQ